MGISTAMYDGEEDSVLTGEQYDEAWKMNALLALIAHNNGGRVELDLKAMREIIGRPLAIHFDCDREQAVVELLPDALIPATHPGPTRRQ